MIWLKTFYFAIYLFFIKIILIIGEKGLNLYTEKTTTNKHTMQ